jgi:plastocyanin
MRRATSLYSFACAAFAAVVVGLGTAGCFSEHAVGPGGPTAAELCNGAQANVVRARDYSFGPVELRVTRGTTVTWANCDPDTHTTTSDNGVWNGTLTPNTTYQRTFDAVGTFPYHCNPHPTMQARIVVVEA